MNNTDLEDALVAALRQAFAEDADLPYDEFLQATARAVLAVVTEKGKTP